MREVVARLAAVIVIVLISGLPIAAVVCVEECGFDTPSAAVDNEGGHCHEEEAGVATTMRDPAVDGCRLVSVSTPATVERASTLLRAAPSTPVARHALASAAALEQRLTAAILDPPCQPGLSPGTSVPLRI